MIIFLVAGLGCLALLGFQLGRPRATAERQRREALEAARAAAGAVAAAGPVPGSRSELPTRIAALLVRIHLKLWRQQSQDDVSAQLRRAGTSRRLTTERFMAGRVALMIAGVVVGFLLAPGGRGILLGIVFAAAAGYLPGFFLSKAASRRAAAIDAELPHFVDQLAIAIEAGMSFDAAVSHLADANDGPLSEELHRILTVLRIGESRRAAMRGFAERVGSENAIAFANAVLRRTSSGHLSPGSSAPRRVTFGIGVRCTPRSERRRPR